MIQVSLGNGANVILSHAAEFPDDEYHRNILAAARAMQADPELGAHHWRYVTMFPTGATVWVRERDGDDRLGVLALVSPDGDWSQIQ